MTRSARSWPLSRKTIVIRAVALAVAGLAIYLLLPSLTRVLASWPRLLTLDRVWLVVALVAEVASFTCTFALQRLALQTRQWFSVVTAGLTGNWCPASCQAAPRPALGSSSRCSRTPGSTRTPRRAP